MLDQAAIVCWSRCILLVVRLYVGLIAQDLANLILVHYVGGLREQNIVLLFRVRILNTLILILVLIWLKIYFHEMFRLVHVELAIMSSQVHLLVCYRQITELKLRGRHHLRSRICNSASTRFKLTVNGSGGCVYGVAFAVAHCQLLIPPKHLILSLRI